MMRHKKVIVLLAVLITLFIQSTAYSLDCGTNEYGQKLEGFQINHVDGGGVSYFVEENFKPLWRYAISTKSNGNYTNIDYYPNPESRQAPDHIRGQDDPTILDYWEVYSKSPEMTCMHIPHIGSCYVTIEGVGVDTKFSCSLSDNYFSGPAFSRENPDPETDTYISMSNNDGDYDWINVTSDSAGLNGVPLDPTHLHHILTYFSLDSIWLHKCIETDAAGICTSLTTTVDDELWNRMLSIIDGEGTDNIKVKREAVFFKFNPATKNYDIPETKVHTFSVPKLTNCYHIKGDGKYRIVFNQYSAEDSAIQSLVGGDISQQRAYNLTLAKVKNAEILSEKILSVDPFSTDANNYSFYVDLGNNGSCGGDVIINHTIDGGLESKVEVKQNVINMTNGYWPKNYNGEMFGDQVILFHALGHAMAGLSDAYQGASSDNSPIITAGKNCVENTQNSFVFTPTVTGEKTAFNIRGENKCQGGLVAPCSGTMSYSGALYGGSRYNNIEAGYIRNSVMSETSLADNIFWASPPSDLYDGMYIVREPTATGIIAAPAPGITDEKALFCGAEEKSPSDENIENISLSASQKKAYLVGGTNCPPVYSVGNTTNRYGITLAWDPSSSTNVIGYKLYIGTSPGNYTYSTPNMGITYTASLTNVAYGTTNYIAATAVGDNGQEIVESEFSNEVSVIIPKYSYPGWPDLDNLDVGQGFFMDAKKNIYKQLRFRMPIFDPDFDLQQAASIGGPWVTIPKTNYIRIDTPLQGDISYGVVLNVRTNALLSLTQSFFRTTRPIVDLGQIPALPPPVLP